ncbi:hypothetical protein L208DRAFT_1380972 [Tricholoma matsutake]|nr:hypothetical protein L208DRAFT_1380972 [Tricholoma matsutake 945]
MDCPTFTDVSFSLRFLFRLSADDGPRFKRPRLESHSRENWLKFSKELWGKGLKNFLDQYVEHQLDNSGASFRMMKTHPAFQLRLKGLLVRDEWDITWDYAVKARAGGFSNFIIVGQTGIGKTLSLYYFLARCLALGLTTFFQDALDYVWLFDKSGVHSLDSKMTWVEIRDLSEDSTAWALVDSNSFVKDPAPVLFGHESPFFIVEAASPRKHRWAWVKYHGSTRYFYANPFSLEEILQGNLLQPRSSNEADLREFFINYGPSARECYTVTSPENGLKPYRLRLEQAITRMPWDDIDRVVTAEDFEAKFDDETSFLIVLIRPADDQRISCRATIITRTILRLLWKAHRRALSFVLRDSRNECRCGVAI